MAKWGLGVGGGAGIGKALTGAGAAAAPTVTGGATTLPINTGAVGGSFGTGVIPQAAAPASTIGSRFASAGRAFSGEGLKNLMGQGTDAALKLGKTPFLAGLGSIAASEYGKESEPFDPIVKKDDYGYPEGGFFPPPRTSIAPFTGEPTVAETTGERLYFEPEVFTPPGYISAKEGGLMGLKQYHEGGAVADTGIDPTSAMAPSSNRWTGGTLDEFKDFYESRFKPGEPRFAVMPQYERLKEQADANIGKELPSFGFENAALKDAANQQAKGMLDQRGVFNKAPFGGMGTPKWQTQIDQIANKLEVGGIRQATAQPVASLASPQLSLASPSQAFKKGGKISVPTPDAGEASYFTPSRAASFAPPAAVNPQLAAAYAIAPQLKAFHEGTLRFNNGQMSFPGMTSSAPAFTPRTRNYAESAPFNYGQPDTRELSYFNQGGLTRGPGDGMSDDIMLPINGSKDIAAVSPDEFVVSADVVSGLGNGSTSAGAKQLYSMMDRVRNTRTGKKSQPREINPDRMLPA